MDKKKKKRNIKKKKNKQKANQEVFDTDAADVEKSSNQPQKVKFTCILCKGDHLLIDFQGSMKGGLTNHKGQMKKEGWKGYRIPNGVSILLSRKAILRIKVIPLVQWVDLVTTETNTWKAPLV